MESTLVKSDEEDKVSDMTTTDDIENWDIPVEDVETVTCWIYMKDDENQRHEYHSISEEDGIRIVEAFNAIQKSDIYWDLTYEGDLFGGPTWHFKVEMKNGESINLPMNPFYYLNYKGIYYFPSFQIYYYDVIREICEKYDFSYLDYENHAIDNSAEGLIWIINSDMIVLADNNINDTLKSISLNEIDGYNLTFNDLLKTYKNDLELNDVVETDELYIKVIEIKEGKITTVAVKLKNQSVEIESLY